MRTTSRIRSTWKGMMGEFAWRLSVLRAVRDPVAQTFFKAFEAVRKQTLSREEADWLLRIEALKQDLRSSTTPVTFYHYGLGARDERMGLPRPGDGGIVDTTVSEVVSMSLPSKWASLLFRLIRTFKPESCLEIGTCIGISSLFQSCALKINGGGRFVTLEGADSLARLARQNFGRLGLDEVEVVVGKFQDILPTVLEQVRPINYAFIDGDHYKETTIAHYEMMQPYLSEGAVLVFDDIAFSTGMRQAWEHITRSPCLVRVFDLGRVGVCLHGPPALGHRRYCLGL